MRLKLPIFGRGVTWKKSWLLVASVRRVADDRSCGFWTLRFQLCRIFGRLNEKNLRKFGQMMLDCVVAALLATAQSKKIEPSSVLIDQDGTLELCERRCKVVSFSKSI